jgi:UPF0755 protein
MSNLGLSMQDSPSGGKTPKPKRTKGRRSGVAVFIAVLLVLVAVAAVVFAGFFVYKKVQAAAPPPDYEGPGITEVVITVAPGQTLTDIGATLQKADVVASTEAFAEAAAVNDQATTVTPGAYLMFKQMSAQGAVERLLDPSSRNENVVTIAEGLRVGQTVAQLSEATGIKVKDFEAALASPQLPLPTWAKGTGAARAEGFLYPATYQFEKDDSAQDIVNIMVDKFNTVADSINFESRAQALGYTPYEVLNVASLIQAEAHSSDFGKVSRVIYNRLNPKTWGDTFGYLGLDATLNYALNQFATNIKQSDLNKNSPYNTRTEHHQGLPPTPINSPGQKAMEAALEPEKGDWLYYATVNLNTGETKFTNSYDEFLKYQQELRDWEAAHPKQN